MIGVTIGIGGKWPEVARRSAERMESMTGVKCLAITERWFESSPDRHPSWLKCSVHDWVSEWFAKGGIQWEEEIMLFDADLWCMAKWNPCLESRPDHFCAVSESNDSINKEMVKFGFPKDWDYLNAGLTIYSGKHFPLWNAVWYMGPVCGEWLEQTPLNICLARGLWHVVLMPRKYNLMNHGGCMDADDVRGFLDKGMLVNLHCASIGGDGSEVLRCFDRYG